MPDQWLPAYFRERDGVGNAVFRVEGVRGLEPGDTVLVRIRRARNPRHHRLYWGMVRTVVEATGRWPSPEALHRWLKYELGLFTVVAVDRHKFIVEWDSTDFMSMGQDRFSEFFERAVVAICLETGIDPLDLDHTLRDAHRRA